MRHRRGRALPMKHRVRVDGRASARELSGGFTLAEMIVVTFLLALAMLGILAVFDASSRINKSETQVADAQGNVRQGLYQMTRAIRMAGTGGLYITQAVLNAPDPGLAGINAPGGTYDNVVAGTTVTNLANTAIPVRPGTDMIEIRGVINSPLVGFDQITACPCANAANCSCFWTAGAVNTSVVVGDPIFGQHVNENTAQRPQFESIDTYTASASAARPFLVIVTVNEALFGGSLPGAPPQLYTQLLYNVGAITAPTQLFVGNTFGAVDFGNTVAVEFNNEFPSAAGSPLVPYPNLARRAGILDDLLFFIDNTDPAHPVLSQGTRYKDAFDVIPLADDVEDLQVAYGVDTDNNEALNRLSVPSGSDSDTNVSNQPGQDEWVPNVPGADNPVTGTAVPLDATNFVANSGGPAAGHFPRLHGVMITLLARSKDPDPTYKTPLSGGLILMNGPGAAGAGGQYRRRVQTLKINLRNYAFEG
jgi:type II secretory pathway pseudopilin PulG